MDVWEREKGEPNLWYGRFEIFRLLGVGRSIDGAYRAEGGAKGRKGARATGHWRRAAQRWRWVERAEAWDGAERETLRAEEAAVRELARQARLKRAGRMQQAGDVGLQRADLDQLTASEARALLGTLRMMLVDGMKQERLEYGESTEIVEERRPTKVTADDLEQATEALIEWRAMRKHKST